MDVDQSSTVKTIAEETDDRDGLSEFDGKEKAAENAENGSEALSDDKEELAENAENDDEAAARATDVKNGIWISGLPNGVKAMTIKEILVKNGVKGTISELKVALHVPTQQSFAYIELEDERDHKLALKVLSVLTTVTTAELGNITFEWVESDPTLKKTSTTNA